MSDETPMPLYMNTHVSLEQRRTDADRIQDQPAGGGPRVVVIGTGRTTVSRILLNYAIRIGRKPVFVDLDVSKVRDVVWHAVRWRLHECVSYHGILYMIGIIH